ncbi:hypothetical protein G6F62_010871 [Rhizopus arrhizus]|nr:hypothetical protein G6F23_011068 [Rhizopus arrhizus]KAG0765076.1 hypothetical protein G6F24_004703 [Rhizopus arrhizus]KAG0779626.1 hypothetical protein G6F22_010530 [Rhizopus arrhizus]KAG0791673.1 hypothetical protein G6F21_004914 [Rhizopus arrhizus]KAG0804923.1 hypothetical protein G6F20_012314 [Rhizopus arrhizus]
MVNKENQKINNPIDWSNQFVIPTSHQGTIPPDFYADNYSQPIIQNDTQQQKQLSFLYKSPILVEHGYESQVDNQRTNSFSQVDTQTQFYFNEQDLSSSSKYRAVFLTEDPIQLNDENKKQKEITNPHLDYSFLLQHNEQMEGMRRKEEDEEEEEPVIGDGARSYSSIGSTSSKRSQKLSKDDKRKRNTAASARFRIKKKMREKALQTTASEMTEKATRMEQRVHELETEIKWLKALIVEKDDGRLEQLINKRPPVSLAFPTPSTSTVSIQKEDRIIEEEDDDDLYD